MNCAQCGNALELTTAQRLGLDPAMALPVSVRTGRKLIRLWFCSSQCVWWGGLLLGRSGTPTTVQALRQAFSGRIEVM